MKLLVYSAVSGTDIDQQLGAPEYSYYFVLKEFLPVLREFGEVIEVGNPFVEVDRHVAAARAAGQSCLFLSFAPPHKMPLGLGVPTLPVFAWEFDTIPHEHWLDEVAQDWRHGLAQCGWAVTHSRLVVDAVRRFLGADFPVVSVPAPVWDKFAAFRARHGVPAHETLATLRLAAGVVLDTHSDSLAPYLPDSKAVARAVVEARRRHQAPQQDDGADTKAAAVVLPPTPPRRTQSRPATCRRYLGEWYFLALQPWLPRRLALKRRGDRAATIGINLAQDARMEPGNQVEPGLPSPAGTVVQTPAWTLQPVEVSLSGVVFTSLFNPFDGRKNWMDMLTAFCAAFRDTADATLVFKLGHTQYQEAMNAMLMCMARMPAFRCRVVLIQGFLDAAGMETLIARSAFVVNTSHGEGQCLPLMEFLSCGKPAIAPGHSAMRDYIDAEVAFVVDSWLDATAWSHDPRFAYRTLRHQINWESLVAGYRNAYRCYTADRPRYERMAHAAIARMQGHCSRAVASERLAALLRERPAATAAMPPEDAGLSLRPTPDAVAPAP